jgi:hypothetical protein
LKEPFRNLLVFPNQAPWPGRLRDSIPLNLRCRTRTRVAEKRPASHTNALGELFIADECGFVQQEVCTDSGVYRFGSGGVVPFFRPHGVLGAALSLLRRCFVNYVPGLSRQLSARLDILALLGVGAVEAPIPDLDSQFGVCDQSPLSTSLHRENRNRCAYRLIPDRSTDTIVGSSAAAKRRKSAAHGVSHG